MDLTELQDVQRTERQMDSLQHLSDTFYADVAEYIAERKAERRRLASTTDDPFGDPAVGRLTDEIKTAEEVVKAIYERRIGKVVKLASFDAADMKTDTAGLTSEERELFDDLVNRIITNREHVLSVLGGEGTEDSVSTSVENPASEDENATQNEADESVPAEPADNKHKATVESQSQGTNSHPGIPNTGAEINADADSDGDGNANPEVDIDIENQTSADSTPDSHVATEVNTDTETETERQHSHSSDDSLPPDPDDVLAAAMGDGGDIVDAIDESSVDTDTNTNTNTNTDTDTSDTDQSNPAIKGDTTAQSTSRNPNRSNTNTDTPNKAQAQAPASASELSNQSTQPDSDPHSNVNANPEVDPQPHSADSSTTPSAKPTDINRDSDNILNAQTETRTKTKTDEGSDTLERETEPEVESDLPSDTPSDDPDRVVLRITADVGRILGVDQREYDLAAEDIIMLPETNAEPLLSRDAAERLD